MRNKKEKTNMAAKARPMAPRMIFVPVFNSVTTFFPDQFQLFESTICLFLLHCNEDYITANSQPYGSIGRHEKTYIAHMLIPCIRFAFIQHTADANT